MSEIKLPKEGKWYALTTRTEPVFIIDVVPEEEYATFIDNIMLDWVPCIEEPYVKKNGELRMMQASLPRLTRVPLEEIIV